MSLKILNSGYIYLNKFFVGMIGLKRWLILLTLGMFFTSCGVVKRGTIPWETSTTPTGAVATTPVNMNRSDRAVRSRLDNAYSDWKGTRYVLGGTSSRGIDCSAFMQVVFKDYLNHELPRTTRQQMELGQSVRKRNIKIGDMVFFRTGRDTYHVGVMINSEQFLHASTSNGVTISNLQNQYWQSTYLTTRRVL